MTSQDLGCKVTVFLTIISLTYCLTFNHDVNRGSFLRVGDKLYAGDILTAPNAKCEVVIFQNFAVYCNNQKLW
jgi:hypothetical protein